jgi:cytochrome c biogenesis protein CcmG, thiol:disulfide interchange protein DsbE
MRWLIVFLLLAACGPEQKPGIGLPLPPLAGLGAAGGGTFAEAPLRQGYVALNVFASWCLPCKVEHPLVTELSRLIPTYGLAYLDSPENITAFFAENGNPYRAAALDTKGLAGVALGITGVPETFVLKDGVVVWRHQGPLDAALVAEIAALAHKKN